MLFFGSHCERVCQLQFSLLSLISGLVRSLQDCADPHMDRYAETLKKPDSVRTSDRASLLAYMGIPLQIFGKGAIFGPYTPLQQLDVLTAWRRSPYLFTELQQAALSVAETVTSLPDEETMQREYAAARQHLSDDQMSVLIWAATTIGAFNRVSIMSRHPVRVRKEN